VVSQAALLHDVLEDTTKTAADLRAAGFPEAVIATVVLLTKPARRTAYSERITTLIASGDLGAILIKMSDNEDNMCPARVLPDVRYLSERYATAFARLRTAAAELGYTGR
jgi:(p)ppGpp synthase/HD superfamily hydrolase